MLPLAQIQVIFTLFVNALAEPLPRNLIPIDYKLQIITNLADDDGAFNFKGSVSIHIKCVSPTENITLHSKKLTIDEGKTILRNLNRTEESLAISGISQDMENDFLTLTSSQTLEADLHYEVELHFESDLDEEKMGYYRTSYVSADNETRWVAVTYFKPEHARRVFPCFDELIFKATFTISLGRSSRFHSLSNMPRLKIDKMTGKPGWEWDHFYTTPPMSTYNVGFTVSDFTFVQLEGHYNKAVTVMRWARENLVGRSRRDILMVPSASFLHALATELQVDYALPKLDIVVMPGYAASTMASWGLVFWDENYMLQINKMSANYYLETIGLVANQMVRQWFGNLVTLKSWSDSWFMDGLCRFITEILVNYENQDVHEKTSQNIISVFHFDSFQNAFAVSTPSNQSESSSTVTDDNVAEKTSLLIRMVSNFVGYEKVHKVIRQYLKSYKYKNAGSEELLEMLKYTSPNINVKSIMHSWFSQAGFPLITVTRHYERGRLEVKQERFFNNEELLGQESPGWWIPLTYTTECEMDFNNTVARKWLSPDAESVDIKGPLSPGDWIIFNIDASGLYMVNYDMENWNLIIDFLNTPAFDTIPSLNRVLLIDNAAGLAWVGRLDYKMFLDMLRYLVQERNWLPRYAAVRRIYDLNALLDRTSVYARFLDYVRRILEEKQEGRKSSGTKEEESHLEVDSRFYHRSGFMPYVPLYEMKGAILCTDATAQYPWSDYLDYSKNVRYRSMVLLSLSCGKNHTLLWDYLHRSVSDETLRSAEVVPIITAIARNPVTFDLVREFLSVNMKLIYDRIFPNTEQLSPLVVEIARHTVTQDELTWLTDFIDTNAEYLLDIRNAVEQAVEIARLNVQWHHNHYGTIESYFEEGFYN